jgi:hypothetical protein
MSKDTLGVALTKCFYCGDDSDIIINSKLTEANAKNVETLHGKVITTEPCTTCKTYMEVGIIVITYDPDKTTDSNNPYRTGGFFVIKEDAVRSWYDNDDAFNEINNVRCLLMEHKLAEQLGLFALADSQNETE